MKIRLTHALITRCIGILMMGFLVSHSYAQTKDSTEYTYHEFLAKTAKFEGSHDSLDVQVNYIEIVNSDSLHILANSLDDEMYPLIIVQSDAFIPGVRLVKGMQLQLLNYELKDREWKAIDSLHKANIAAYQEVIGLQKERVGVYKEANAELNTRIGMLSEQLTLSTDLTNKTLNQRSKGKIGMAFLGGAVGVTLGILLGVVAGN